MKVLKNKDIKVVKGETRLKVWENLKDYISKEVIENVHIKIWNNTRIIVHRDSDVAFQIFIKAYSQVSDGYSSIIKIKIIKFWLLFKFFFKNISKQFKEVWIQTYNRAKNRI